jgi:AraC-like DNA-binding protein
VTVECTHTELWSGDGIRIESRRCDYGSEKWTDQLYADSFGVLLPIGGAYRLKTGRVTQFVDRGSGSFRRPGEEVRGFGITRVHASTAVYVDVDRFDAVDGADWPSGERHVDAHLDLLHRLLRRDLRMGANSDDVEMRTVEVIGAALEVEAAPAAGRRSTTAARHRQIAAEVLEVLHQANGSFSLIDLSRDVGCSPFHLSRIFHEATGVTLRQYRARTRLRAALDLLEQGERDLSAISATCGFADHSHLTRTAVAQLGASPTRLRELLHPSTR